MSQPKSQHHLYEIHTDAQSDLVIGNILSMYASKERPAEASRLFLFFLARSERRLPTRCSALLTCRRGDCLDLFLFRFLRLSVALLLAFSHANLSFRLMITHVTKCGTSHRLVARRASYRIVDLPSQLHFADLMKMDCHC